MKIAVSDFDGTLCRLVPNTTLGGEVPEKNLSAIRRWRAAGNKFGIASGRGLPLLEMAVRKHRVPVDFMICSNGSTVFDGQGKLLDSTVIPPDALRAFLEYPLVREEPRPFLLFGVRQVFSLRPYPDIPLEYSAPISWEDAADRKDVVQLSIMFRDPGETQSAMERIQKAFPMLRGNPNRVYLDLNLRQVNKRYGIERLVSAMGWDGNELLVIGDDKNDLPMIEYFHGFTVDTAQPFMKEAAVKVYDSVGRMLEDNL